MNFDFLDFDRKERSKRRRKMFIRTAIWVVQIALVIGLAYFIVNYTIEKTRMPDESMEPVLSKNDTIIFSKSAYWFSEPERYDVIVFSQSSTERGYYNIKRVIGLPGETVLINGGQVYINGELLEMDADMEEMLSAGLADRELLLEDNEYFVLGDARNNSEDSRFADVGTVVKSDIIGKAWIRTKPDFAFISMLEPVVEADEQINN